MPAQTITLSLGGEEQVKSPASRAGFWYSGRLRTHTLCVADPQGPIPFRGSNYREITVPEAIDLARTDDGVTYLLEKDLFETRDLKVGTYCRDVTSFGVDSVEYRIQCVKDAVEQLALSNVDVVLAPEYFFSKESSEFRKERWEDLVHYSEQEMRQVVRMAQGCTDRWPNILMVLGSVLWIDQHQRFRNTCVIAYDGDVVQYDKRGLTAAELRYADDRGCVAVPGEGYHEVDLGGYPVLVQVCADCLSERPGGEFSLFLLPACGLGGAMLPRIPIFLCDGAGQVKKMMPDVQPETVQTPVEDIRAWDVTIQRRR